MGDHPEFLTHDLIYLSDELAARTRGWGSGDVTAYRAAWASHAPRIGHPSPEWDQRAIMDAACEVAELSGMSRRLVNVRDSFDLRQLQSAGERVTVTATFIRVGWSNYTYQGRELHTLSLEAPSSQTGPRSLSLAMSTEQMLCFMNDASGKGHWAIPFVGLILRMEIELPLVAFVEVLSVSDCTIIVEPLAVWLWVGGLR